MNIYGGVSVQSYYLKIPEHVKSEIDREEDNYILGVNTDEYTEFLFEKFCLEPIIKDTKRKPSIERVKHWKNIEEDFYSVAGRIEVERINIGYPIMISSKTADVFEMDWGIAFSVHDWSLDQSKGFIFALVDNTSGAIQNEIKLLDQVISNKNALIEEKNPIFKETIKRLIEDRKKKVEQDADAFEKLVQEIDIPLEIVKKDAIQEIDFNVKPEIKNLVPPAVSPKEEYVLDRKKVQTIIQIIDNITKTWEAAPSSYNDFEEERLRDIILSSLNSVFSGKGTAETFRNRGKTDIYLNIEKGYILIMECKWWKGKETLNEAFDQLFRYLTWRENYGIIILFSKNKGFTSVLSTIGDNLESHESYSGGFQSTSESNFMSHHIFPDDDKKTVEVHTLAYNLYCNPTKKS